MQDWTKRVLEEWDVVPTTRDQFQTLATELMTIRQALWDGDKLGALARLEVVINTILTHIGRDESAE